MKSLELPRGRLSGRRQKVQGCCCGWQGEGERQNTREFREDTSCSPPFPTWYRQRQRGGGREPAPTCSLSGTQGPRNRRRCYEIEL